MKKLITIALAAALAGCSTVHNMTVTHPKIIYCTTAATTKATAAAASKATTTAAAATTKAAAATAAAAATKATTTAATKATTTATTTAAAATAAAAATHSAVRDKMIILDSISKVAAEQAWRDALKRHGGNKL